MRVQSSPDKIFIRYFPTASWTVGLLTIIAGAGLMLFIVAGRRHDPLSNSGDLLNATVLGLVLVAGSYLSIFDINSHSGVLAAATTVVIDSLENYVQISRLRIYGCNVKRYSFYQVYRFRSYKVKRFGFERYFLGMKLQNHRTMKLGVPIGRERQPVTKLIKDLNRRVRR